MLAHQMLSLDFYDAVISNNVYEVKNILEQNLNAEEKISVKIITGLLMIAVENKLTNVAKTILEYNDYSREKILSKHLNVILCVAAKNNILKDLQVTFH